MIISEVRSWKVECGIVDFDRIASSCYIFMYKHELNMCTQTRIAKKDRHTKQVLQCHKFMIAAWKELHFKLGRMGNVDNFLQLVMLH